MSTDIPSSPPEDRPTDSGVSAAPASRGRKVRSVLIALVALGAIGAAGYSVKDQIPWLAAPHGAGNPPEPVGFRNALTVVRVDSGLTGESPAVFVSLGRTQAPHESVLINDEDPRRLLNELVRQSVLLAARDRLGAIARDEVLGEEAPEGIAVAKAEVVTDLTHAPRGSSLTVKPLGRKGAEPTVMTLPKADSSYTPVAATYPRVLERAEVLAREELPKVLKTLGVTGAPPVVKTAGPVPDEIRERLMTLTFTEQFAALRMLHAAIRADGESPERLGALVRGYANLGCLTEFHWSIAHDVFKARALLTAQRWVARDARSADALRHRAYAYALAGLHRFALDDLAAARSLATGPASSSEWEPLIDAYCRFNTTALLNANAGAYRPLALFLALRTVEGTGSLGRIVDIGRELLREVPECYRAHDAVCAAGGISVQHVATTLPMETYRSAVPRRLKALPDLSPGIAAQLDDETNEVSAARALIQDGRATDRGEPSWGVLGRMMDEVRFVQVWRRAEFLAFGLGVPAGEFVESARPLVAFHPYRGAVEALGVDRIRDYPRFQALLLGVKVVEPEGTEIPFVFDLISSVDATKGQEAFRDAALREDTTECDLKQFLPRAVGNDRQRYSHFLADVSPHSPVARAGLIETSWSEVESNARAWEDEGTPRVLVALGRRYIEMKRWADAERCLSRSAELLPEKESYELLAHIYQAQGDWKRWRKTLDRYLERVEDYGLDHMQIQAQIANHLMDEHKFKEAEPYAVAAAQTWAGAGLICAERCYEGLEDWTNAELWTRRESERYPDGSWAKWYLLCKRSGHGDLAAARDFTARYISGRGASGGAFQIAGGCFYLMNGQKAEALDMFRGSTDPQSLSASVLCAALTADALGDTQARDQHMDRLVTDPQCNSTSRSIDKLFRNALQGGEPVTLDLAAVDKAIAALPEQNRGANLFFTGWFLSLHGSPEKAAAYLDRCMASNNTFFWYQYVAKEVRDHPDQILGRPGPVKARPRNGAETP